MNQEQQAVAEVADDLEPSVVTRVADDYAIVRQGLGLSAGTKRGMEVEFSGGAKGVLLAWKEETGIVAVQPGKVRIGETVSRTGQPRKTFTGPMLRGRIVNCLGVTVDDGPKVTTLCSPKDTFGIPPEMGPRSSSYRPYFTQVLGIDFVVPIGRGQTMMIQGSNEEKDRECLWPDLFQPKDGPRAKGESLCVVVCKDMDEAVRFREKARDLGCLDRCTFMIPPTTGIAGGMLTMNAAVSVAEDICSLGNETEVLLSLEPMQRVFMILADAATEERMGKGIVADPTDEQWVQLEDTIVMESIAERRIFWFSFISRAANFQDGGSVTLLTWAWEQAGGQKYRAQQAYDKQLERLSKLKRVNKQTKAKVLQRIKDEAEAAGLDCSEGAERVPEPSFDVPGSPNWDIEELKSITDGHILLNPPPDDKPWGWLVDPYKSLPRLGTDALHPALISVDAIALRLHMMQGRDRANLLKDEQDCRGTLGRQDPLDMKVLDLVLEQPAGQLLGAVEQVVRLAIVSHPKCNIGGDGSAERLRQLATRLAESEVGKHVNDDIRKMDRLSPDTVSQVDKWITAVFEK